VREGWTYIHTANRLLTKFHKRHLGFTLRGVLVKSRNQPTGRNDRWRYFVNWV